MNIQQLEYLIAVDRHKHFGKAAQACFITQPTLSAMIHKLEDELDLKIFDRTTHPIRTTDIGVQIIEHAKKITDEVNELRNKANLLNNIVGGKINIGIIPTVSTYILPNEIFKFLAANPEIEMSVKEMTTDSIIKALKAGELDAGIIATPYETASEFYNDYLFNEELMLYSSNMDKDKDSFVTPDDINTDKVWLLEEGNCLKKQFENICHLRENSLKPKNLEFLASNMNTIIHMVDEVGGISILPELAIEQLNEEQKRKIARFRKPHPYREISVIYYKPTYKQKIIDEMMSFIQNSMKKKLNFYKATEDFVNIKPE